MNWIKKGRNLILLYCCMFIVGCGMLDDGRMAAWENVRMKEEDTKQKILELRERELSGAFNAGDDVPMLTVTTQDSNGQPVVVSMNLMPMVKTIISAVSKEDGYGVEVSSSKQPTGQAGESLQATAKIIKAVGSSPATLVLLTGEVMARGIDAAGERMKADEINIGSNNSAPLYSTTTTSNTTTEAVSADAADSSTDSSAGDGIGVGD
jgi:hypothetical protein